MSRLRPGLHITGDEHADQVLTDDPFALLVGMLLDQQYPMEHAFRGPAKILDRFGTLDPATIAAADPEEFAVMASTPPAIHRYGRSMAGRRAGAGADRDRALRRPGRAAVDRGVVGRGPARAGDGAAGVRQAEGADLHGAAGQAARRPARGLGAGGRRLRQDGYRSVADVVDPTSLQKVRDYKKAKKAAAQPA